MNLVALPHRRQFFPIYGLSYLSSEDMEGVGEPGPFTNVGTGHDWDYTTNPGEGSESYRLNQTSQSSYSYDFITGTDNITVACMVRINSFTSPCCIWSTGAGGSPSHYLEVVDSSGNKWRLTHGTTSGTSTETFSTGQWYYTWGEFRKGTGSDGVCKLFVSPTTRKPSAPIIDISDGNSTTQPTAVATSRDVTQTGDFQLDHWRVFAEDAPRWPA